MFFWAFLRHDQRQLSKLQSSCLVDVLFRVSALKISYSSSPEGDSSTDLVGLSSRFSEWINACHCAMLIARFLLFGCINFIKHQTKMTDNDHITLSWDVELLPNLKINVYLLEITDLLMCATQRHNSSHLKSPPTRFILQVKTVKSTTSQGPFY